MTSPKNAPLTEKQIKTLVRVHEKFLQKQQELQDAAMNRMGVIELILDGYPTGSDIDLQNGVVVFPPEVPAVDVVAVQNV